METFVNACFCFTGTTRGIGNSEAHGALAKTRRTEAASVGAGETIRERETAC